MGRFLHVVLFLVVLATRLALCFGAVCSSLEACSPATTNELELAGCYRFCDPWKDTPLYCACINNTVPVCLGCIPYMQEFSGFYESEYSCSKCSACSSWGSTQFASCTFFTATTCGATNNKTANLVLVTGYTSTMRNRSVFVLLNVEELIVHLLVRTNIVNPVSFTMVDALTPLPHSVTLMNSVCFMDQSTNILCPGVIASDGVGGSTGGDDSSEISGPSSLLNFARSFSPYYGDSSYGYDGYADGYSSSASSSSSSGPTYSDGYSSSSSFSDASSSSGPTHSDSSYSSSSSGPTHSDSSSSSSASGSSSSPDVDESCVSIDCLPDVQRCTSNQYRCLDGSCVNDRSKCSNNGIAPSPVRPVEDTVDNTKDSSITFTALSGDENNQNRTLGSLQVKNGTFAAPTVISVSPASFAKLYELLGKNFTRSILSSVVSLRAFFAADNDGVGAELSEGDFLQPVLISLIVDQVVSEGEACMAFLDETEKVWRCLADTTVTTVDDFTSSFSAFTPHFTDFAVLLAEDTSDGGDDGDGDDGTLEDGVVDETAKNEDKEEDETDIGPIVGGTVGGVVFLVVIFFVGVALVWYIRKRLQERGTSSDFQSKVVNFGMDEDDDLSL
ncbi:Transmembrane protein [Balamuthia mandrillaris]